MGERPTRSLGDNVGDLPVSHPYPVGLADDLVALRHRSSRAAQAGDDLLTFRASHRPAARRRRAIA